MEKEESFFQQCSPGYMANCSLKLSLHDSGLPFDEQAELQSLFVQVNSKRVGLKLPNDRLPFKMSHDK